MDWSRKLLNPSADEASAEPEVAMETGQLTGALDVEVVMLVVTVLVELDAALLVLLVLLAVTV
jgi:hypothetical protein